jgi:Flp pilus assembly protein TadB
MLRRIIVLDRNNYCYGIIVLTTLLLCAALGVVLLVFRPLLVGILRAAWLVVFPRLSREQRQQRKQMRDSRLIQRMIDASTGPSLTAELRAMACRQ